MQTHIVNAEKRVSDSKTGASLIMMAVAFTDG